MKTPFSAQCARSLSLSRHTQLPVASTGLNFERGARRIYRAHWGREGAGTNRRGRCGNGDNAIVYITYHIEVVGPQGPRDAFSGCSAQRARRCFQSETCLHLHSTQHKHKKREAAKRAANPATASLVLCGFVVYGRFRAATHPDTRRTGHSTEHRAQGLPAVWQAAMQMALPAAMPAASSQQHHLAPNTPSSHGQPSS
jgi:hypothetical protein